MKLILCLIATLVPAFALDGYENDNDKVDGNTIDSLTALTEILEGELKELNADMSDAATLCAVGDDRIHYIKQFFLAHISLVNSQQDSKAEQYNDQIKALIHRVDDAIALEKEAQSLAEDTEDSIADLMDLLVDELQTNDNQDLTIHDLEKEIADCKELFLKNLEYDITSLDEMQDEANDKIHDLGAFVASRKCEYGSGAFDAESMTAISFKTSFDYPPHVSLVLTGFVAHMDIQSYDAPDVLSLDKYAQNITTSGFNIKSEDLSSGLVDMKCVYCSWMACQGLTDDLHLHS